MAAFHGADPDGGGVRHDDSVDLHYVIPAIVVALFIAIVAAVVISLSGGGGGPNANAAARHLPPWWTVHSGESYSEIAQKTGSYDRKIRRVLERIRDIAEHEGLSVLKE